MLCRLQTVKKRQTINIKQLTDICNHVMMSLGMGHTENVYQLSVSMALNIQNIPHTCEAICPIRYLGECVGVGRADIVIGKLILELKANCQPPSKASSQLAKYMTALQVPRFFLN